MKLFMIEVAAIYVLIKHSHSEGSYNKIRIDGLMIVKSKKLEKLDNKFTMENQIICKEFKPKGNITL
jgi:hypothetical protein